MEREQVVATADDATGKTRSKYEGIHEAKYRCKGKERLRRQCPATKCGVWGSAPGASATLLLPCEEPCGAGGSCGAWLGTWVRYNKYTICS